MLLTLAYFAIAQLNTFQQRPFHQDQLYAALEDAEVAKKFHNLSEAIAASEKFVTTLKDMFNLPSLVFGISVRGKTIWSKSWGSADLENQVNATLDTSYRLASISKTFTSVLIGTLVDQGKWN